MTKTPQCAWGLDLAGLSTGNSGLASIKLERDSKQSHTVTVYKDHPFKRERSGESLFADTAKELRRVLEACTSNGNALYVDIPIDLQALLTEEEPVYLWETKQRSVDKVFSALSPIASLMGAQVMDFRHLIVNEAASAESMRIQKLGSSLFETYPKQNVIALGLDDEKYRYKGARGSKSGFQGFVQTLFRSNIDETEERLDDDDIDAILCALVGIVQREHRLECDELRGAIQGHLESHLPRGDAPRCGYEPPKGYCVLKEGTEIPSLELAVTNSLPECC